MNLKKHTVCLLILLLSIFLAFLCFSIFIQFGYYTETDLFGIYTNNALFFGAVAFLISLLMIVVFTRLKIKTDSKYMTLIALIPTIILIVLKYILPIIMETHYVTDFYDATSHTIRGLFVANTGHSDPTVDSYFDIQPGFFWVTGMVLRVIGTNNFLLISSSSVFLQKWFTPILLFASLPILFFLYKKLLGNISLASLALFLQFAFAFSHYHFAAQSFGDLLYWLSLILVLVYLDTNYRNILLLYLVGLSLVFVHQGLTIFALVELVAMVAFPYAFYIISKGHQFQAIKFSRRFVFPLLTILLSWLCCLMYLSLYQFDGLVNTFNQVISSLLFDLTTLFSSGATRANPIWSQIVMWKAIWMALLLLIGLILSLINAILNKSNINKAVFSIQLFTDIVIGGIALALGGAGYIERLFILLPLIVYSICEFLKIAIMRIKIPKVSFTKHITPLISVFLIFLIIISGFLIFFSGRNFQAITYSEVYGREFATTYPTVNGLFSLKAVHSATLLASYRQAPNTIYGIYYQEIIHSSLYIFGDSQNATRFFAKLSAENNLIYDNGKAQLILQP